METGLVELQELLEEAQSRIRCLEKEKEDARDEVNRLSKLAMELTDQVCCLWNILDLSSRMTI